jgi:short-subunit dehydrogenase
MDHKRIVITGASSGIGRALAVLLAHLEHKFILIARREGLLQEVAKECLENGANAALPLVCDVSQHDQVGVIRDAVQELRDGEIVLVNNAADFNTGPFTEHSYEEIRSSFDTNLLGPLMITHTLLPLMLQEKEGQILNVLSVVANRIFPKTTLYSTSKAAMLHFSKVLSEEVRSQGIRVSAILPGAVATPAWGDRPKPKVEDMLTAESVAELITDLIMMPKDRSIDLVEILPPKGILPKEES